MCAILNTTRLLVLAPHTDDAELGAGGLITRFIEEGMDVFVVAFSAAEDSLPKGMAKDTLRNEFQVAQSILGVQKKHIRTLNYSVRTFSQYRQEILDDLVEIKKEIKPSLVCLPCSADIHQDHQVIHNEGKRLFKDITVLGYELPWNQTEFTTNTFVSLNKSQIEKKWEALQAYRSQLILNRSYFSKEFIYGLAKLRGTQIKAPWAEAFEVVRMIL